MTDNTEPKLSRAYMEYLEACFKLGFSPFSYEEWQNEYAEGILIKYIDDQMIKEAHGGDK